MTERGVRETDEIASGKVYRIRHTYMHTLRNSSLHPEEVRGRLATGAKNPALMSKAVETARKRDQAEQNSPEHEHSLLGKPQGAPRGLLIYYILFRLSQKPAHGYEILQDIESKTEGAWRPGPGSVYPIFKKLLRYGYIRADRASRKQYLGETSQRVYRITEKGEEYLREAKGMFANMSQRWMAMRRIFIDCLGAEHLSKFFVDGSRLGFQMAQETFKAKLDEIPKSEAAYMLKEYALILERQLDWARETLNELQHPHHHESARKGVV